MKALLEAGVHFGHQTRRWNPKMAPYIYTERNGIYIIDLQKTVKKLEEAYNFVRELSESGQSLLFVGTKKQAQEAIKDEALRCNMFYVNARWLGGMMTNFKTMRTRVDRLNQLKAMQADGMQQQLGFAYAAPVAGEVTSAFGLRTHPLDGEERFHYGLDIGAEEGSVVTSFAAGTITAVGSSADLGEYVMVAHANGYTSLYAHCSRVTASSGQQVALGDPIAEVGQTGQTTGSHLHFELHQDTVYLNPIYYVQL